LVRTLPSSLVALKKARAQSSGRPSSSKALAFAGNSFFAQGTHIQTADGEVRIEKLRVDQLVETQDYRPQPVRCLLKYALPEPVIDKPIRFAEGAIGNGRDLIVSPRHRMLISDGAAEMYFAEKEVLVPAACLIELPGAEVVDDTAMFFYQIVFDRHQIVFAEGCAMESFQPGLHTTPPLANLVDIRSGGSLRSHMLSRMAGMPKDTRPSLQDFEVYLLIREIRKERAESGRPIALVSDDIPPSLVRCYDRYRREELRTIPPVTDDAEDDAGQDDKSVPDATQAEPAPAQANAAAPQGPDTRRQPERKALD